MKAPPLVEPVEPVAAAQVVEVLTELTERQILVAVAGVPVAQALLVVVAVQASLLSPYQQQTIRGM